MNNEQEVKKYEIELFCMPVLKVREIKDESE